MNYNPRVLSITNSKQAVDELTKINCDPTGIRIMSAKAVFKAIKLENIPTKAANLLKQTFLAKGGEAAIARGSADLSIDRTDVLVCATIKQYRAALTQLKSQPWGLPKIAQDIEDTLFNVANFPTRQYSWGDLSLAIKPGKTLVMGIINLTPDSFSDGGKFNHMTDALRQVERMIADGADIIDVGAESTRPYGAAKISAQEEIERLAPILEKILAISTVPVSVDTYKADVAAEALKLGAHMINDVWGLQHDPMMAKVAARYNAPVIVMHNQLGTDYQQDIMSEICAFLRRSIDIGLEAGLNFNNIIIDPGIGFGKTPEQNLVVMSRLEELKTMGCPVLLGASRKRFIGEILGLPVDERVEGTGATVSLGIAKGVNIVRVHDVKAMVRIATMTDAMMRSDYYE